MSVEAMRLAFQIAGRPDLMNAIVDNHEATGCRLSVMKQKNCTGTSSYG
jgi:hypothetical protein